MDSAWRYLYDANADRFPARSDFPMRQITRNILHGAGSILDMMPRAGIVVVGQRILERSDAEAVASDWQAVGEDVSGSIAQATSEGSGNEQQKEQERARQSAFCTR